MDRTAIPSLEKDLSSHRHVLDENALMTKGDGGHSEFGLLMSKFAL
jgi:hypothetical protein